MGKVSTDMIPSVPSSEGTNGLQCNTISWQGVYGCSH